MPFNSYSDLGVNTANSEVKIRFDNRQRAFHQSSLPDYFDISFFKLLNAYPTGC